MDFFTGCRGGSRALKTKWEVSGSREERTKPGWCVSKGLEDEKEDGCQGGTGY